MPTPARLAFVVLVATLVAGCAAAPPSPEPDTVAAADVACARHGRGVRRGRRGRAARGDGAYARVDGFRTLRVDRLLASYANDPMDAARFGAWIAAMRALDRDARAVELANLPADARAALRRARRSTPAPSACSRATSPAPNARVWLIESAVVPDDYRDGVARARPLSDHRLRRSPPASRSTSAMRAPRSRDDAPRAGPVVAYRPAAATTPPRRSAAPSRRSSPAIRCRRCRAPSLRPSTRCSPRTRPCSRSTPRATTIVPAVPIAAPTARRTSTPPRRSSTRASRGRASTARCCRSSSTRSGSRSATPAYAGDPLAGRLDGLVWRVHARPRRRAARVRHDPPVRLLPPVRADRAARARSRASPRVEEGAFVVRTLPSSPSARACASTSRRARTTCAA